MKIRRSILIPVILLIYLAAMSIYALPDFLSGVLSPLYYFGVIGVTLLTITLLHLSLKRRERLRREREQDQHNNK